MSEPKDIAELVDAIDETIREYNRDSGPFIVTSITFKTRKNDGKTAISFRVDPRTSVAVPCVCGDVHKYKKKRDAMVCRGCGHVIDPEPDKKYPGNR